MLARWRQEELDPGVFGGISDARTGNTLAWPLVALCIRAVVFRGTLLLAWLWCSENYYIRAPSAQPPLGGSDINPEQPNWSVWPLTPCLIFCRSSGNDSLGHLARTSNRDGFGR